MEKANSIVIECDEDVLIFDSDLNFDEDRDDDSPRSVQVRREKKKKKNPRIHFCVDSVFFFFFLIF